MAWQARGLRRFEVAWLVADQKAVNHIHRKAVEQVGDHARSRLAAIADATVALDSTFGVVRTIFERIDMRAKTGHVVGHPAVQGPHVALLVEPPRDAGLIADDK